MRRPIARWSASALLGVALVGPVVAQSTPPLRVGMTQEAPFGLEGYCGELMPLIAERAGLRFDLVAIPIFAQLFPTLVDHDIDILCTPAGVNTANRQLGISFTSPIFTNEEAIAVLATDDTPYTGWGDFIGLAVGANQGAGAYRQLVTAAGVTDLRLYTTETAVYEALLVGEVKAAIVPWPAWSYRLQTGQYRGIRLVETYVPAVFVDGAIAVHNTEFELLGRLQTALEGLKGDGTIAALTARWSLPPPHDL